MLPAKLGAGTSPGTLSLWRGFPSSGAPSERHLLPHGEGSPRGGLSTLSPAYREGNGSRGETFTSLSAKLECISLMPGRLRSVFSAKSA